MRQVAFGRGLVPTEPNPTHPLPPLLQVAHQVETYLQAIIQATVAQEPASSDPGSPPSTLGPVTPFRSLSGSSGTPGWTRTPGPRTIDPDLSQYSLLSLSQMSQVSCATARDFGEGGPIPAPLMSAALLTFGRLCLVSEQLAKKYIAVFVNQLRKSSHEIIKANILAILADLCVEYSGSVDKFVPVMSWCMGDKSVLVRHTAIVLLTQLLAEGFIKWKNNLFFSFLVAVADDHRIVAHFAESALVKVLLPKVCPAVPAPAGRALIRGCTYACASVGVCAQCICLRWCLWLPSCQCLCRCFWPALVRPPPALCPCRCRSSCPGPRPSVSVPVPVTVE